MNNELIVSFSETLKRSKNCVVNIINDKLTLAVFSMLRDHLKNVREINFIIRDTRTLPQNGEVVREFDLNPSETLFNSYDIIEKNKLTHFEQAKEMSVFIKHHVNIRKTTPRCKINGNILLIDEEFMIQGSSSLELSPKAKKTTISAVNFDSIIRGSMDKSQIIGASKTFEQIWNNSELTECFKDEILCGLDAVYKDHSPEFLYYFTLHELFGHQLDSGVERFEQDNMSFKKSQIWKMLYDFQKDGVLSAIQKINKYNGCIIADSVGLGKTFEALAVIKYFELRQDNVLVLTPAKLYENWNSFRGAYKDSILDESFYYKIMFHTDLSRYKGESRSGWDLARFDWSKFDLIVIDESHNFRNRTEREEGMTRYQRLLHEVIKKNQKTKVLLLSATPVNNSLNDLKNQISMITGDDDSAFDDEGIVSIGNLLTKTTQSINKWDRSEDKDKRNLLDQLPSNFYKLLELMTISRSRKHITDYYGTEQVGTFPEKMKPDTLSPDIDTQNEHLSFKATNMRLEELLLAIYMPMSYIKNEHKAEYREKYQTKHNDKVIFTHEDREFLTAKLHRFNLFKRLDSSVYSFHATIERLRDKIATTIALLMNNAEDVELVDDSLEDDDASLDYKYDIKLKHLKKDEFLSDLYYDQQILNKISEEARVILHEKRDNKLQHLVAKVEEKVKTMPYNPGNKKVLIFTAFADTARYLYAELTPHLSQHNVTVAMVSGSDKPKVSNKAVDASFNGVLSAFSPKSKVKHEVPESEQVDVLIGTDCISEGQNLQDCDCVINYDIQWNPVALIQRFGRIDRIGSDNKQIKMINFFPALELNEYLSLEKRVKSKMHGVNLASTGNENDLEPEMNDISFRTRQLKRLKDEVIDIDEASENISLTDLNLNEYLFELADYIKRTPEITKNPRGIYSITPGDQAGVLFCFKHRNDEDKPKSDSSLYPYYLIYMDNDGKVHYGNRQAREVLNLYRKLCYEQGETHPELIAGFLERTDNVKEMRFYSNILSRAIESIQGVEEEAAETSIFDFGGFNNAFADETQDDFELISFLVVE